MFLYKFSNQTVASAWLLNRFYSCLHRLLFFTYEANNLQTQADCLPRHITGSDWSVEKLHFQIRKLIYILIQQRVRALFVYNLISIRQEFAKEKIRLAQSLAAEISEFRTGTRMIENYRLLVSTEA